MKTKKKASRWKPLKYDLVLIVVMLSLSFFLWRHIPSLKFTGEGLLYSIPKYREPIFSFPLPVDTMGRLLFTLIERAFQGNVPLYFWFLLLGMLLTDLTMYVLVRKATGSRTIAFFTSLIFSLSFIGKFDTYSLGVYFRFVQRAILAIPEIVAFLFLILYFKSNLKSKYYFISLFLHLTSVAAGFFSTWFIAPFFFYPLFYWIFSLQAKKFQLKRMFWTPIPFVLGNYLIIQSVPFSSTPGINSTLIHSTSSSQSFLDFLIATKPGEIIFQLLQQLTVITLPVKDFFGKMQQYTNYMNGNPTLEHKFDPGMILLFHGLLLLTPILYGIALVRISKLGPHYLTLASTSFASLIIMLIFNLYMFTGEVTQSTGSSRLFFYPFIMVSIFWGLFFSTLFTSQKTILKVASVIFCFFWIFYNINGVEKSNKSQAPIQRANQVTWNYLNEWSSALKTRPSYVYLPTTFGSITTLFAFRYYSHPEGKFTDESLNVAELLKTKANPEDVYVLYYDPLKQVVINKTEETRFLLSQNTNRNHEP